MFEDALRFPWQGEDKLETIVIGGVLTLLGVVFVPILFVYGYLVRVIRLSAEDDIDAPPSFGEWGELLVEGLVGFVISLVYVAIPAIVVTVGVVLFFVPVTVVGSGAGDAGGGALAAGGLLLAITVFVLSGVLTLAAAYLVPAAVAAYARTGRFGAAFSPSTVRPIVTSRRYAIGWLVAVAVALLAQIAGSTVSLTGIGAILVPFLTFYGNVAGAYAIGSALRDLPPVTDGPDAPAGQPAV